MPPEISSQIDLSGSQRVAGLVDVGQLDGVAQAELAGVGLLLAGDHAQQRRLAGAVGADDADDPRRRQGELQPVDEQPVAVALAQPPRLDDDAAQPRAGRDVDLDVLERDVAVLGQQRLVAVQARLGLAAAGTGGQARPLELAGERAPVGRLGLLLVRQALLLLLQPGRVVALEGNAAAAVELEDPAGDVVEEVAVVGHRDDGALVVGQVALEPGHGLGVEVVGGLVEQQQVGLAQQQAAQGHAPALAAAQRRDVGVGRAAAAARPWRSRAWCRGSTRRRRRSAPAGARTRPRCRRRSWPRAR